MRLNVQAALLAIWLNGEMPPTQSKLEILMRRSTHREGRRAVQRCLQSFQEKRLVWVGPNDTLRLTGDGAKEFYRRVIKWKRFGLLKAIEKSMVHHLRLKGLMKESDQLIFNAESGEYSIKKRGRTSHRLIHLATLASRMARALDDSNNNHRNADWAILLREEHLVP